MNKGKVYLIGAGPGDPGLFTLKGKEVLAGAEVVVYDYLANEELLQFAPPEAERIYVGKKGGDHTLSQDQINRLLVDKGATKIVARLKGGDPFVFGRGGEEAQDLVRAGIPFEIVPGVTAAVAVPAYAGIPLSHRDHAASMAFITGHEREDQTDSKIDWSGLATGIGTLVFFMGVKNLPEICAKLMEHGRPGHTPAAVIRWGTTPSQVTVCGTLENIAEKVAQAALKPPAIIIVGQVVALRDELNWFESKPLFGRTIVVTRAREQASEFKVRLSDLGAHCVEFPTIAIEPPSSWEPVDRAIAALGSYQWVIFTSVNGVRYFMQRLWQNGKDARSFGSSRLVAIGQKTAEEIERHGLRVDVVPREYRAESVLEAFLEESVAGQRFLMPRAAVARDVLPETLRRRGAEVEVVPAYQTVLPHDRTDQVLALFERRQIDCLTFTSSSTVGNFFRMFERDRILPLLADVMIASIGPVTADTAAEHGLVSAVVPSEFTIEGLTRAICAHFERTRRPSSRGPDA